MRCFSGQVVWKRTLMYQEILTHAGIAFTVVGISERPSRGQMIWKHISASRKVGSRGASEYSGIEGDSG